MALGDSPWQRINRTVLVDGFIFDVVQIESESPEGKRGRFTLVEAVDWATVIPVLYDGDCRKFVMVRQFRHGSNAVSVEFPGGALEPGEDPEVGVSRELLEETGYAAGRLVRLGTLSPNPAFMTNRYHVFLADDLKRVSGQRLDEHELVDILVEPEADVLSSMGCAPYDHALMVAACHLYRGYRDSRSPQRA